MSAAPRGPVPHAPHLSAARRREALEAMADGPLDLLVIGGGITGAGTARAAALRGLRVGLVEKSDFAAGTSSRSSKIIHGGVRYLEYLQLGLVRESARERAILRRLAPHLVHPLPFLYPVWKGESFWKIRGGLLLFDLLAGSGRGERSRSLSAEGTRALLPGLRAPLVGAVRYPEYITDDARFTLANVRAAAAHGALVANHAGAESLLFEGERVAGARVRDLSAAGGEVEVRARVTVNATGPWALRLLEAAGVAPPGDLVPSKGIHLLFARERLPLRAATFLRSSTGRAGLAMPRGPWVYVGTSDEEYPGDLDHPRARAEEVDELLGMTRDCFPDAGLTEEDVVATWAGIRPLIREEGKSTREMSRHDEIWNDPPGLVTVAGGKLTTYRPMANRILEAAAKAAGGFPGGPDRSSEVPLAGAPAGGIEGARRFREHMRGRLEDAGVGPETRRRLLTLYGTELETILGYAEEDAAWLDPLSPDTPALRAEVRHAVEAEMASTLEDVLDRRLALLLFTRDRGRSGARAAAGIAGELLGWGGARIDREVADYRATSLEHGPRGKGGPRPGDRASRR